MQVLVTGGAGYVGSHCAKALAAAGHVPVVYDNLATGNRWAVRYGPFEHGDITDLTRLTAVMDKHRIEAVMHFAALSDVGASTSDPLAYYAVNVVGTHRLLVAMRARGITRIVFSSTCAIYGMAGRSSALGEDTPALPISPYGQSKNTAERMIADSAVWGLGGVALRYFNAAGADEDGEIGEAHEPETHLIPLVLHAAAGLRPDIKIFGRDYPTRDGTCVRDYIHVADLAAAHVQALQRVEPGQFAAYNLGTGSGSSVLEVIDAVRRICGRPVVAIEAARRPGDPPELVADPARAHAALGFTASLTLDDMIESAWRFLVNHGNMDPRRA
ncbi:UDP-glucose 4-epimerase GalE [Acuticoccus sediminis]|uniref:UDP-glucose 4-epimerase n=1 Tax=Acuticoccus sediminis TaxID=2184697 RepID=A0A8B2NNP0_9HYPH|nr:UDP-glucose 4-epimerase GalE [Acuticoccus sediminis]RAH98337.1 UDP-glucose 4-epimerase GalE [Acuticoccus sediminis]